MDKRWYPAAMTVALIGCGGSTDSAGTAATGGIDGGEPTESGGGPVAYYGVLFVTGGAPGLDSGVPSSTGGNPTVRYGVLIFTGGRSGIDSGIPAQTGGVTPMPPYGIIPNGNG